MRLHDSNVALVGERVNGIPRFSLRDVLELPKLDTTSKLVYFSDVTEQDKLELTHMHTGHVSKSVQIEGFRRGLFTGTGLDWKHLRQKAACMCRWCA